MRSDLASRESRWSTVRRCRSRHTRSFKPLRVLHGGRLNQLIDFDLFGVDELSVVPSKQDLSNFNHGFVMVNETNVI